MPLDRRRCESPKPTAAPPAGREGNGAARDVLRRALRAPCDPTTPITVTHSTSLNRDVSSNVMRLPIGSMSGQKRLAASSSTTTTFGTPARSVSAIVRPRMQRHLDRLEESRRHLDAGRPTDSAGPSEADTPRRRSCSVPQFAPKGMFDGGADRDDTRQRRDSSPRPPGRRQSWAACPCTSPLAADGHRGQMRWDRTRDSRPAAARSSEAAVRRRRAASARAPSPRRRACGEPRPCGRPPCGAPSFSACCRSARDAVSAGANPKSRPVASAMPSVYSRTAPSMWIRSVRS